MAFKTGEKINGYLILIPYRFCSLTRCLRCGHETTKDNKTILKKKSEGCMKCYQKKDKKLKIEKRSYHRKVPIKRKNRLKVQPYSIDKRVLKNNPVLQFLTMKIVSGAFHYNVNIFSAKRVGERV